ncbi:MAG: glycosyltransferase [Lachnospiraceae bacterium]|nr:glycosyltransferase [Lachnospiraceae bacterium]
MTEPATVEAEGGAPLVSVCIPAYNNASTIRDTVESVLASDYKNIEVIIVDDCSSDDTFDVAEAIDDERVFVCKNYDNLGMAGNWNRCLSCCKGEYIRLLCADDRIDADLISTEVGILDEHPRVVMVSTDTAFINEAGEVVGHYDRYKKNGVVPGREIFKSSLFTRDYLGAPLANLFRKSAAEAVGGFDTSFSYIIDYDFFGGIALLGDVYVLHEKKNYFMLRSGSNTSRVLGGAGSADYIREHRLLVEKYAGALGLGGFEKWLSVMIRRATVFLGGIYLGVKG